MSLIDTPDAPVTTGAPAATGQLPASPQAPATAGSSVENPASHTLPGDATSSTTPTAGGTGAAGAGETGTGQTASGQNDGASPDTSGKGKKPTPEEQIAAINAETEAAIRKMREDAQRRIALAQKTAVPLPQRKTNAFDFMEKERDRIRGALEQPTMPDADVDAHIKAALDAWHAARQTAQ